MDGTPVTTILRVQKHCNLVVFDKRGTTVPMQLRNGVNHINHKRTTLDGRWRPGLTKETDGLVHRG